MTVALASLVAQCGGSIDGDAAISVERFAPIERAGPDEIAFIADQKWLAAAAAGRAGVLIARPAWAERLRTGRRGTLWLHPDPYLAFARASQIIVAAAEPAKAAYIESSAVVAESASIGADVGIGALTSVGAHTRIGAGARIGAACAVGARVEIGPGTVIHAHVTIYDGCTIGADCIVHSGAVIGADGFGYARDGAAWVKIPQVGRVRIGDRVEIGANTTIDRGALDDTVIGDGVKLDNQIQIAHNVVVGDDTAMAGCVGVAGSTRIGKRCTFGGAAMVFGHLEIADDVHVSGATVVSKSIRQPGRHTGYFPIDEHRAWERNAALVRHLAELRTRIRALEAALGNNDNPPGQDA